MSAKALEAAQHMASRCSMCAYWDRAGFHARTIDVMDGSKRSGHSNAFFTGFGFATGWAA